MSHLLQSITAEHAQQSRALAKRLLDEGPGGIITLPSALNDLMPQQQQVGEEESVAAHPFLQYGLLRHYLERYDNYRVRSIGKSAVPCPVTVVPATTTPDEVGLLIYKKAVPVIFAMAKACGDADVELVVHTDNYTMWNMWRRKIENDNDNSNNEMKHALWLNELALSLRPKSQELWTFRSWCCCRHRRKGTRTPIEMNRELQIVHDACVGYARNYFAWKYRTELFLYHDDDDDDISQEMRLYIPKWLNEHVTDNTAMEHAHRMMTKSTRPLLLISWFVDNTRCLIRHGGNDSLFLHRRWLLSMVWTPEDEVAFITALVDNQNVCGVYNEAVVARHKRATLKYGMHEIDLTLS
eukprot:PhM_4_TR9979/c0_g1_i1/m.440/K14137/PTAR1; protein prenyltransferase alpha subunit repeat containing protein 1